MTTPNTPGAGDSAMTTEAKRETGHEVDLDSPDSRTSNSTMERLAAALERAQGGTVAEMRALGGLYASDAAAIRELVEAAEAFFEGEDHYAGSAAQKIESTCEKHMSPLGASIVKQNLARLRTALQGVRNER